tara:strand:- start:1073 stop:1480 length:408 start_codon:yes stop_codon:yes gene_type:complete
MKKDEINIIKTINDNKKLDLKLSNNQFEYYDAYNDNLIVEIKKRNKVYDEKFIQVDKFYNLLMIAQRLKKHPIYVVADNSGIFIYDLIAIEKDLIFRTVMKLISPIQTEFKNNTEIYKYYYLLKKADIYATININ